MAALPMHISRSAAALTLAMFLSACSWTVGLFVLNNTTEAVEVTVVRQTSMRPLNIPAGQGRLIAGVTESDWVFQASYGACRDTYVVPLSVNSPDYPFDEARFGSPEGSFIKVQIEPDRRLHLVPGTTVSPGDVGAFEALQSHGFPLSPQQHECD